MNKKVHPNRLPLSLRGNSNVTSSLFTILIILVLFVSLGCISLDTNDDPEDSDHDGVPDHNDEFPYDKNETKDFDNDGIGDNADPDDDNDGVSDEEDEFPYDKNESSDNDNDGIGDNADFDDDNDGYNDSQDMDPLHDLALLITFNWLNVTEKLYNRAYGWFHLEIYQDGVKLGNVDNNGTSWKIQWKTQYNLSSEIEVNVPDNVTTQRFEILTFWDRWFSKRLLDTNESNSSYETTLDYDLAAYALGENVTMIFDGSLDNMSDEPDAQLSLTVETITFSFTKTYSWSFQSRRYELSYKFDPFLYNHYKSKDHRVRTYGDYVTFATPGDPTLIDFSLQLHQFSIEENFSQFQEAEFILTFVQSLKYAEDNTTTGMGEYPKYPIETLVDQMGDCEDTAILMISISEILNIESALLLLTEALEDSGHAAAGLSVNASGSYYEINDTKYYYAETTGMGWQIGDIPEFNSTEAYIFEVM